jgi:hypothetical protein
MNISIIPIPFNLSMGRVLNLSGENSLMGVSPTKCHSKIRPEKSTGRFLK